MVVFESAINPLQPVYSPAETLSPKSGRGGGVSGGGGDISNV